MPSPSPRMRRTASSWPCVRPAAASRASTVSGSTMACVLPAFAFMAPITARSALNARSVTSDGPPRERIASTR